MSQPPTESQSNSDTAGNGADRGPTGDERSAEEHALLESLRRGEVDAVLGAGPRAGEVLVVKRRQLEEQNHRLIEELRQEKDRLEDFAVSTAHDLRGPLTNVEGAIATLLDRKDLRVPIWLVDSLREIEHSAFRMRLLVSDLLMLGESASGAETPETVELFDVVASVLDGYRTQLSRTRVRVEIVDRLPSVAVRVRALEAIFDNLVDNAIRYAAETSRGAVKIGCTETERELILWVRDNGAGFDPREAEVVFEPYIRLDKRGGGTGLGLTIVRKAAAAQGGRAWIESVPAVGTTAFVALPIDCARKADGSRTPGA